MKTNDHNGEELKSKQGTPSGPTGPVYIAAPAPTGAFIPSPTGETYRQIKDATLTKNRSLTPPSIDRDSSDDSFDDRAKKSRETLNRYMVHTRGIDEYYKLRFIWSWVLVISLGVLLFFQCILVILIGCGKINFVNYQTLINIQAVEYFGQIVGMCYIVVKYLFKDPTQNIDEKNTNDKDNKTNNKQGQT